MHIQQRVVIHRHDLRQAVFAEIEVLGACVVPPLPERSAVVSAETQVG